jgi:hypothetical protein
MSAFLPEVEAWSCMRCGQLNTGWASECGRCELPRLIPSLILRGADRLAAAVNEAVRRREIGMRSPMADALLDYATDRYGDTDPIGSIEDDAKVQRARERELQEQDRADAARWQHLLPALTALRARLDQSVRGDGDPPPALRKALTGQHSDALFWTQWEKDKAALCALLDAIDAALPAIDEDSVTPIRRAE